MAGSIARQPSIAGSDGLGGIAALISTAAPLLFGAGKKSGTSTTTPANDPAMLAILQSIVAQSTANANDPNRTADLVSDILRKAQVAFTPVLSAANRSGLYNSSTVQQLANESISDATRSASKAVLDYQTEQQKIAASGAASLVQATRSETTNQTQNQAGLIPSSVSSLLGLGLAGATAWSQRKKLLDLLGLGGGDDAAAAAAEALSGEQLAGVAVGSGITGLPVFSIDSGAAPLPTTALIGAFDSSSYTAAADGGGDLVGNLFRTVGDADSGGGADVLSGLFDNLPSSIGDAVSGVTDFISGAGQGIVDAGDSLWQTISGLFDFSF